jgi:hypothetical protein
MSAIVATLGAAGAPAGLTVHRERTRPIEIDSLPAILVYAEDAPKPKPWGEQNYRAPLVERQVLLRLECRAEGTSSTAVDVALDPITVWATQQMLKDVSFGGLANEVVEENTAWQSREGDLPIASCAIHFTVKFRTSRLDPTTKG